MPQTPLPLRPHIRYCARSLTEPLSLNLDSLLAKNEFYYKGNDKFDISGQTSNQKSNAVPF